VPGLPAAGASYTGLPRGRRYEGFEFDRGERDRQIQAQIERERLKEAVAALSGEASAYGPQQLTPQQFFSEVAGSPIDGQLAERAAQFVDAMPELEPIQALRLALKENKSQELGLRGARAVPAEWVEKIANSGEVSPDLAAKNLLTAANQGVMEDYIASPAQERPLSREERAQEILAASVGSPYRTMRGSENVDESAILGRGRGIPGTGRRNPFDREQNERIIDSAYRIPVLTAPASQAKRGGPQDGWRVVLDEKGKPVMQPVAVKTGEKTAKGYDEKVFDPRQADVVMLDPTAEVPGYYRQADPKMDDSGGERAGVGIGAPTLERQYYPRDADDPTIDPRFSSGSEVPGFRPGEDPAAAKVRMPMTLSQVVQQIVYENSAPIKSYVVKSGPAGEQMVATTVDRTTGETAYYNRVSGEQLFPLKNQDPRNIEAGIMDFRVGSPTEITNEGYRKITELIASQPGMTDAEGHARRILVNEPMMDPAMNRAQNALLQQALSEEFIDVSDPSRKPIYSIVKALRAGKGVAPGEGGDEVAEILARSSDEYQAVKPYLAASSLNPKVKEARQKARKAPQGRPQLKSYADFARAIGDTPGSSQHDKAMIEMALRVKARNEGQAAVNEEASNIPQRIDQGVPAEQLNAPTSAPTPDSGMDAAAIAGTPDRGAPDGYVEDKLRMQTMSNARDFATNKLGALRRRLFGG